MAKPGLLVAPAARRRRGGGPGMALVEQMLDHQAAQIQGLAASEITALGPVLKAAQESLAKDLAKLFRDTPGDHTFTRQQLSNALVMVNGAIKKITSGAGVGGKSLEGGMREALAGAGGDASKLSARHLNDQLARFGEWFEGTIHPVQIQEAAVVAAGAHALIPRYRTSAARYSKDVQADIRAQIAVGFLRNETFDQMTKRLVHLGGPRGLVALRGIAGHPGARVEMIAEGMFKRYRHMAERVVRTEAVNAYNVVHQRGIEDAASEDPEILKRWDAAADWRVCPICRDLDGTIADVDGVFRGGYRHPPAHPNDRCTIVPWKAAWMDGHVGHPVQRDKPGGPTPVDPQRHDLYQIPDRRVPDDGELPAHLTPPPSSAPAPAAAPAPAVPVAFPTEARGFREGAKFTVAPEAIVDRVHSLPSGIDRGVRLDKQRKLLADGKSPGPVKMSIDSTGTLEIIDGRHRWLAALEAGKPVEVKLYKAKHIDKTNLINLRGTTAPAAALPAAAPATEAPIWVKPKNPKRVAAARLAGQASAERLREIHSAVATNLPEELRIAWEKEGHKFLREESKRIKGIEDRINASSKISEAFAEKYGAGDAGSYRVRARREVGR